LLALSSFSTSAAVLVLDKNGRLPRGEGGAFEICWTGPLSVQTRSMIAELERYLAEQLTDRAGIALKFRSECLDTKDPFFPVGIAFFDDPDTPEGIRSEIRNMVPKDFPIGHPMTYSGGIWSTRNLIDINLSSRFEDVTDRLVEQSKDLTPEGKLNLQKSIALHELLHAFGYAHEHSHRDSTCEPPPAERYNDKIHTLATAYDPLSILDYCRTGPFDYESGPIPLSELDIEGLAFYREP
jgi:hypothetical protein